MRRLGLLLLLLFDGKGVCRHVKMEFLNCLVVFLGLVGEIRKLGHDRLCQPLRRFDFRLFGNAPLCQIVNLLLQLCDLLVVRLALVPAFFGLAVDVSQRGRAQCLEIKRLIGLRLLNLGLRLFLFSAGFSHRGLELRVVLGQL